MAFYNAHTGPTEPAHHCPLCPRLCDYRAANAALEPDWFNGPAPSFGADDGWLLIVGLAPGRTGANRTGRPFTGDYAGDLLYATLAKFGLTQGEYAAKIDDGLAMVGAKITNAVRCAPPQNKPEPSEIANCQPFLSATIAQMKNLKAMIALGKVAHDAVLTSQKQRKSQFTFGHGNVHKIGRFHLYDSYHCSRYNTNTNRLTPTMFEAVFEKAIRDQNLAPTS